MRLESNIQHPTLNIQHSISRKGRCTFGCWTLNVERWMFRRLPPQASSPKPSAFTLLELLVVITVIVILITLLAPALDRALTASEMAKCGANLKTIANASTQYSQNNKQRYPKRQNNYYWDALMMRHPTHPFDIRPQFQDYLFLDAFVDPLLKSTKLDDGSNSPETVVYSNYSVYTGWGIPGFASLDRVGDRFTFQHAATGRPDVLYKFDILAADEDYRWPGNYTTASHPDVGGKMAIGRLQDQWTNPNVPATVPAVSYRATIAWWVVANPKGVGAGNDADRSPLDTQFVHEDNSVQRFTDVKMFDDRMIPIFVTGLDEYNKGRQAQVPSITSGGK